MRRGWVVLIGGLLLVLAGGVTAQPTERALFGDQIQIEAIEKLGDGFVNPMLTITFTLRGGTAAGAVTVTLPEDAIYALTNADGYCPLHIVALADSGQPAFRLVVSPDTGRYSVRAFAFCTRFNLLSVPGPNGLEPPPASAYPPERYRWERPNSADTDQLEPLTDPAAIIALRDRVLAQTCLDGHTPPRPLTFTHISTQFAVFILNAPTTQRDLIWRDFQVFAQNPLYGRDRAGIYCLLAESGISEPAPTPTATPTPTPTPAPIVNPTPTPLPLPDQPIAAEGTLLSEVSFAEFFVLLAAALGAGLLVIVLLPRRVRGLLLVLIIIIGAILAAGLLIR